MNIGCRNNPSEFEVPTAVRGGRKNAVLWQFGMWLSERRSRRQVLGLQGSARSATDKLEMRSRASVITELCSPPNVVGVTLIRIMCCMNNTAGSTHSAHTPTLAVRTHKYPPVEHMTIYLARSSTRREPGHHVLLPEDFRNI